MEQMFREMDANHDGSIGFEEFVAAMKVGSRSPYHVHDHGRC